MLLDLLAYAVTPCSWRARSLGLLTSSLQVQARYRRCRRAWEPHLAATRRLIVAAAHRCPSRRTAVLFGAGLLHDIPLAELAGMFQRVVLVDVIFPWASRAAARRHPAVVLQTADVTGTHAALAASVRDRRVPLPVSEPRAFLDDPALDLAVSVNVLSQLPLAPHRALLRTGRDEAALEDFSRHLQQAHLDYLRRLPGHTALITDTSAEHRDRAGRIIESWDNLHGLELPRAEEEWEWRIAPAPEADPQLDRVLHVRGFADWKAALRNSPPPSP